MAIIAFDVDDTLILPPEATGRTDGRDVPSYEIIALYWQLKRLGNRMIVWSGGGKDYAQMWADKLGLEPDEVRNKSADKEVDICFDDCIVDLAKINIKVPRWNNRVTRTLPNQRFK